ncbi:hypothetical protein Pla52o_14980 [Novipirellula galeiformis]|uniref:DUF3124 domain-containing protein n=1 Tax=Novipirellula galeiformis TaxID=2528004 RepID=A0A5C6CKS7_9BACT|nr:DUF3124 domain-containing protein [Novipirellula galeiformis]TWU25200.1 hypothetical protein Pla52o_14980 [Novipirellula galeiformis]
MNDDSLETAESVARRLKLVVFVIVVVPIIVLAVFMELRFEALEDGLQFREPDVRDEVGMEVDSLPWPPLQGQTLYVPAYSQIDDQSGKPRLLTVTLSVRNSDRQHEIVVTSVRYYDSGGKPLQSLLKKPLRLGPLASTEFVMKHNDKSGRGGSSFIVQWMAGVPVTEPVVETVMIESNQTQGIAFVRSATVLETTDAKETPARE